MTLGLDTSVVVRLLIGLPEAQARSARRRLEQALGDGDSVVVTDLALAEAYHALQYHYRMPRAEARSLLRRFAESGVVRLEPATALAVLGARARAGFVDRLIHERHRSLDAVTLTLDRQQGRLEGAIQLQSS